MKGSTKTKLLALASATLLAAAAIVPGVGTLTAKAGTNYDTARTNDSVETTTIKKFLQIEDGSNIPNATFRFTASAGTAVTTTNEGKTIPVFAGVTPGAIQFILDDTTTTDTGKIDLPYTAMDPASADPATAAGGYITIQDDTPDTDHYLAIKNVTLNFANVVFTEPGIYRYVITESGNNAGVGNDSVTTRTLDVYVQDANDTSGGTVAGKKLLITHYVLYKGTLGDTDGPANPDNPVTPTRSNPLEDGTSVTTNGYEVAGKDKSLGFTNYYPSAGITFGKEVKGNQGSKDKYFKYTLTITNSAEGTLLDVDYSKADATITVPQGATAPNAATTCISSTVTQPATLTVGTGGTLIQDFYLQDGQYITVSGLADGMHYELAEDAEEYKSSATIAAADSTFDKNNDQTYDALSDGVSGDITKDAQGKIANIYTGYTNTKAGVIPTGVILSVAPWVVAGIVILAGVVFFAIRSKRKYEEQ